MTESNGKDNNQKGEINYAIINWKEPMNNEF